MHAIGTKKAAKPLWTAALIREFRQINSPDLPVHLQSLPVRSQACPAVPPLSSRRSAQKAQETSPSQQCMLPVIHTLSMPRISGPRDHITEVMLTNAESVPRKTVWIGRSDPRYKLGRRFCIQNNLHPGIRATVAQGCPDHKFHGLDDKKVQCTITDICDSRVRGGTPHATHR